jgi:predicted hydrocarbon binding protein
VGDFSKDVPIPEAEDDLTPVYVGVQVMIEVVREALQDLSDLNRSLEAKVAEQTAEIQRMRVARPLVRRMIAELAEAGHVDRTALESLGERLAVGAQADALAEHLAFYEEMGLGWIRVREEDHGRYVFAARDLLERREGTRMPTCFLAAGYLKGAVSATRKGARSLVSEVRCQSRGDDECVFVVQARGAP